MIRINSKKASHAKLRIKRTRKGNRGMLVEGGVILSSDYGAQDKVAFRDANIQAHRLAC
jgi:hypothetical protein